MAYVARSGRFFTGSAIRLPLPQHGPRAAEACGSAATFPAGPPWLVSRSGSRVDRVQKPKGFVRIAFRGTRTEPRLRVELRQGLGRELFHEPVQAHLAALRQVSSTPSAFAPGFLDNLRRLSRLLEEQGATPATEPEALLSGPLTTQPVTTLGGTRHAVVLRDEPLATGGQAAGLFLDRAEALRAAAVFPAVAAPTPNHLKDRPKSLGWPLHCCDRHVGHLGQMGGRLAREHRRALLQHLHLARYLATHPHAFALLLESVGPQALPILGRALARRIEAALP